jgi:hypothetical protein
MHSPAVLNLFRISCPSLRATPLPVVLFYSILPGLSAAETDMNNATEWLFILWF